MEHKKEKEYSGIVSVPRNEQKQLRKDLERDLTLCGKRLFEPPIGLKRSGSSAARSDDSEVEAGIKRYLKITDDQLGLLKKCYSQEPSQVLVVAMQVSGNMQTDAETAEVLSVKGQTNDLYQEKGQIFLKCNIKEVIRGVMLAGERVESSLCGELKDTYSLWKLTKDGFELVRIATESEEIAKRVMAGVNWKQGKIKREGVVVKDLLNTFFTSDEHRSKPVQEALKLDGAPIITPSNGKSSKP